MSKRLLAVALAFLCAAAAPASAQEPQASPPPPRVAPLPQITFGVEVLYVEVDAIVTDRDGKAVRDLTRDDFEIREEGKAQKVEVAAFVDIPLPPREPSRTRVVEPDVRSNERPFEGRLYAIVLDDLHTAALRSNGVKKAAQRFIERYLGESDLAAVVYTSGRRDASQDLTDNRRLLLLSVDKFMGRRLRSATLNRLDAYNQTRGTSAAGERVQDPEQPERAYNARNALSTLKNVADWLADIHGRRKALVYFSEGIDYDVHDLFNNKDASDVLDATRDVIAAATRANVSIYSVDPRGLHGMFDESMELTPIEDPTLGLDGTGLRSEQWLAQQSLQVLAEETVGRAAVSTNDFEGAFERIVADNSAYYVLGYRPPDNRRDGRFRKIQVSVKRPGLTVRARPGYASHRGRRAEPEGLGDGSAPRDLRELIGRPLQQSGLEMALHSAVFRGAAGKASVMVALQVQGTAFRYTEKDGQFQDALEVSVAAIDRAGKLHGSNSRIPMQLKPETRRAVDLAGFRLVSTLELAPGRYQLRVAARSANSGKSGSVFQDLEVPDFASTPFSISGLALTSAATGRIPTAGGFEPLKGLLPAPPTTIRAFDPSDTLALAADIYDNDQQPHTVDITTRVVQEDGAVKFRNDEERKSDELKSVGGGSFVHKALIPLKDLAPGSYTLQVEARSRLAKRPPAVREIPFRVLPPANAGG